MACLLFSHFPPVSMFYPPTVAKVRLEEAEVSTGHSEVVLVIVVEVSTKTAGLTLVGTWHAHLKV